MTYKFQMDNGYMLWTFQGEMFYQRQREKFFQFLWRPRPPLMLDDAQKKKVTKNLRKYERSFERADKQTKRARELLKLTHHQEARTRHREIMAQRRAARKDLRAQLAAARGVDVEDESNFTLREQVREIEVEVKE